MKNLLLIAALLITTTATAKDRNPIKKKTKPYKHWSAIIIDGKTIKNPTVKEYNHCFVQYLLNNTWESNVYRWEYQHIMKNWNPKTTTTASDKNGHILNETEKLQIDKNNFFYFG
jgi:hypothetical protein